MKQNVSKNLHRKILQIFGMKKSLRHIFHRPSKSIGKVGQFLFVHGRPLNLSDQSSCQPY
jgi:hypothetical protein